MTPTTGTRLVIDNVDPARGVLVVPLSVWWLSLLVLFWLLVPAVVILAYRVALP